MAEILFAALSYQIIGTALAEPQAHLRAASGGWANDIATRMGAAEQSALFVLGRQPRTGRAASAHFSQAV